MAKDVSPLEHPSMVAKSVHGPWAFDSLMDQLRQPEMSRYNYSWEGEDDDDLLAMTEEFQAKFHGRLVDEDHSWPAVRWSETECQRSLIVKVLGKSTSSRYLQQKIKDTWHLLYGCEVTDLEHGFFIVRSFDSTDYFQVLERGPWMVLGHYLTIAKWRPNLRPGSELVTKTMVWVRFPNLLLEFYDETCCCKWGVIGDRLLRSISLPFPLQGGVCSGLC